MRASFVQPLLGLLAVATCTCVFGQTVQASNYGASTVDSDNRIPIVDLTPEQVQRLLSEWYLDKPMSLLFDESQVCDMQLQ